jgi:hypothetical protein
MGSEKWKDDIFEGRGVLYGNGCDWIKYEGGFKTGTVDGLGIMVSSDGNVYTGSFKNARPHGRGRILAKMMYTTGV